MASTNLKNSEIVDRLFNMIGQYGQGDYIGEPISQIEHCLQAANCAREAGASDATVLAALLHDCGQILPQDILDVQILSKGAELESQTTELGSDMLLPSGVSVGRHGHDVIGANYLASLGFPAEVCELVRDHVVAKRYLTAVEEGYYERLSAASKGSLVFQGGPFSASEIDQFKKDILFREKVQMRRFDDAAKVIGAKVPPLESYKDLAKGLLCEEIQG
ncbi:HD phosphohydrolase-like protein [Rhodocollybia butyracea]|uniref:HD phosphohydrolase-like protein n=1 Tax=Rhodocollybia butyracea TaxID=206335 RepID=A0A9P5QA70_9AGAR|nr:HD phosphohydrolase-like protein [Rhodocollybia butyracea]